MMRLIGMLDSPYVRRVAISLNLQGIAFTHEPLSVFSSFDAFASINPVVKAPTLVTDEGVVLMESTLILEHAQRLAAAGLELSPGDLTDHGRAQRIVGLALAACEKTVQILYERNLRPLDKQHEPWLNRLGGQLHAAYRLLEEEVRQANPWLFGARPLQADVTSAVAFRFTRETLPEIAGPDEHPGLAQLSARAEATRPFQAFPFG